MSVSRSFQAEKKNGEVEVEFMFDASKMKGKSIVVFEELYYKERLIASHADLDDENQTVSVAKNEEKESVKKHRVLQEQETEQISWDILV